MKRIATHCKPDADALLAVYLMARYGFEGESEVVFVSRAARPELLKTFDCVVDVGRAYDPARRAFDHKPPAFSNRNEQCASSLVWEWLRERGAPVESWRELVATVHEGDARPPRRASIALGQSRQTGFHALIKAARLENGTDAALYQCARRFLDEFLKSAIECCD